jgi:purine-nucleoside phosphorylase
MTDPTPFSTFAEEARAGALDAALVLGSGMSALADRCQVRRRLPFPAVPGLAATSVAGHNGCLTLGDWAGRRVLVFEGRLHYYEGHAWRDVVQPVHVAQFLGAQVLLLTNAAGGIHEALGPGSLMAVRDHLEWTRSYTWRHPGPGERPAPYSARLLGLLEQAARQIPLTLHQGVYAAVTGPCYETPAEIRALRACGADAVGMSTAREVRAGYELGMECAAVSCVTNRAAGLSARPIHHEEVLQTAAAQAERLAKLVEGFLYLLGQPDAGGEKKSANSA